jgi:26S proteasome regulatory subunit N4
MLLAASQAPDPRRQASFFAGFSQQQQQQPQHYQQPQPQQPQTYTDLASNNFYSFGTDQPLFDFNSPSQYAPAPMQSDPSTSSWLTTGQLTPSSSRAHHNRASSLSSLGSVGPASPYAASTSNPHVAGDLYHDFHDYQHPSSKPLTPAHTPLQEQFLSPHYPAYYTNPNTQMPIQMSHDGLKHAGDSTGLLPARPSRDSSPATPPMFEGEDRRKHVYRGSMPKLDRTMTDVYVDELYNPGFQMTSTAAPPTTVPAQNDVFTQRLQAANNQHLRANTRTPLTIPSRERSPFRQGSPFAQQGNGFSAQQSPNVRFGTATHMREQQKAENDARALRQQIERTSPEHTAPKTISPKDVDLVYHEKEEDADMPLFSQQQQQPQQSPSTYNRRPAQFEPPALDESPSQQSYGSMATSRRQSSSAYSTSSHATPQPQNHFHFAPPAVAGSVQPPVPQQYPFVPQDRRQPSNVSTSTEDFPATLTSMDSSGSEYAPEGAGHRKRPSEAAADTGTYTCTYHGCTQRFETPAKLQRHKREGHRNSGQWMAGAGSDDGMTSAALRNTQDGPHKCERINPSTGKPCNTIFSRPYDLTRHEDTIHNARKQKVRCPLCTEEKTFSRNDALTRHYRVCHPDHVDFSKSRRRGRG